jgi:hypothetical protein
MPVQQEEDDYLSALNEVKEKQGLVIQIVDLFDLEGSILPENPEFVRGKPLILVGNKMDLFPLSVKKDRLEKYLRRFAYNSHLYPEEVVLCSAVKGENIDAILKKIEKVPGGENIFVIGTANVGKSTLMNQLLFRLKEENQGMTTSEYPGTTLHAIRVSLPGEKYLIDTPGYLRNDRLNMLFTPSELKRISPKQRIDPRVYQLQSDQTLFFGGIMRMDFVEGEKQSFVCYVANGLYMHRTKRENADSIYQAQVGKLFVPPEDARKEIPWKKHVFHFDGKNKEDIVLSSLGWIACGRKNATVHVYAPENVCVKKKKGICWMRIGIFGGTFDPVHLGHLLLAEQALESQSLDEVWFVPARISPHKQHAPPISSCHRLKMLQMAITGHPRFSISLVDLHREGPSYTLNTLQILQEKHPFFRFFLILGTDLMKDLLKWYKIKEILQIADLILLERAGSENKDVPAFLTQHIYWIYKEITTNISSTLIRNRLKEGLSVRYMIPKKVWHYIKEHSLYET